MVENIDIPEALERSIRGKRIRNTLLDILSHHGIAAPDRDDDGNWVISMYAGDGGYVLDVLVEFAERRKLSIDEFFIDMRFDLLDA